MAPLSPSLALARFVATFFLAAVVSPLAAAAQAPERVDTAVISRIRDEGFNRSQVMETASWLTDVYGPRLTNSPNTRAAADWTIRRLASWGITNGRTEPWG